MEKYRAALLQMDSGPDMEKNKEQVERLITEAAQRGATLALLPETWDYIGRDMAGHGQPIPGSASEFLRGQAQKHGIYLLGGSCSEAAEDGKIYNTSLFYSPQDFWGNIKKPISLTWISPGKMGKWAIRSRRRCFRAGSW